MTALSLLIPTVGRESLGDLLASLQPQTSEDDLILVICDRIERYDFAQGLVERARESGAQGLWRCYPGANEGCFGHPGRNHLLDHLQDCDWQGHCWSVDDDDRATFGALDMIRAAVDSREALWYVFRMRGGDGSHFPGLVVPATGGGVRVGEVGTPMMVFPSYVKARFGTARLKVEHRGAYPGADEFWPAGYLGDYELAQALRVELGEPKWRDEIVAEVRPAKAAA